MKKLWNFDQRYDVSKALLDYYFGLFLAENFDTFLNSSWDEIWDMSQNEMCDMSHVTRCVVSHKYSFGMIEHLLAKKYEVHRQIKFSCLII